MTLNDIKGIIVPVIAFTLLLVLLISALGHCLDPSPQTNQQIVTMYIKHCNPQLDPDTRAEIAAHIVHYSRVSSIPYEVITAIMKVESYYNPSAIGPVGEVGLMQIYTMECAGMVFEKHKLYDIEYNIAAGVCILHDKLRHAGGNLLVAIGLYNGRGPAAERFRRKVIHTIIDIFSFRVANSGQVPRRRLTNGYYKK